MGYKRVIWGGRVGKKVIWERGGRTKEREDLIKQVKKEGRKGRKKQGKDMNKMGRRECDEKTVIK